MAPSTFRRVIVLFAGLFIFFAAKAQHMTTIDILQNLKPYAEFLEELKKEELPNYRNEENFESLEKTISSEYSFITLGLNCRAQNPSREYDRKTICEIKFEVVNEKIVLKEVYHANPLRKLALSNAIAEDKKISGVRWQTELSDRSFCQEYLKYLTIADEIASVSVNCASGDNYRPGFYNEIRISEEGIELYQVNRMNSRSLDHKENYSMRHLEILIPFGKMETTNSFDEYIIGEMKISFIDNSSPNLKSCGDVILKKIKELKTSWKE